MDKKEIKKIYGPQKPRQYKHPPEVRAYWRYIKNRQRQRKKKEGKASE